MSLERLAPGQVQIATREGWADRRQVDALVAKLRPSIEALGERGSVLEVPASEPLVTLAYLEACWQAGRVPLPKARIVQPSIVPGLPLTDASLVLQTSGSTGRPKYVEFELGALERSAQRIARYLGLHASDRVGLVQPLEHGFGLIGQLFAALHVGASVLAASSAFAEEQACALNVYPVTVIASVPYTLSRLLDAGLNTSALRSIGSAGGPLPKPLGHRLRECCPQALIWNQYGCTEAGPRLTACPSTHPSFALGSAGPAIDGVELCLSPDGEVLFRTDTAMRGYLGDPEGTAAMRSGPYWRTGDLGKLDAEGHLFVLGRTDEVIKVRGEKVSLRLIAEALERNGASSAIAVAVEDERSGELKVVAFYEASQEISRLALARSLPLQCLPAHLHRLPSLPRLAGGKPDRHQARLIALQERL